MVFTELRNIHGKKYYYRVISIRNGKKVSKKRLYLGFGLSDSELKKKEEEADKKLLNRKSRVDEKIRKNIEKIKIKVIKILKQNKVSTAGIFGSYVRGEQKKNSDVDILVELNNRDFGLIGFIQIKNELERNLGKKVDLVEYDTIRKELKDNILREEVRII
jgi:predicted nucleotidyltransferase